MQLCQQCCKCEFWPLPCCIMNIWPDFKGKGKLFWKQIQCNPVRFWPLGGFLQLPCVLCCTPLPFTQPELKQFSLLAILSCHQAILIVNIIFAEIILWYLFKQVLSSVNQDTWSPVNYTMQLDEPAHWQTHTVTYKPTCPHSKWVRGTWTLPDRMFFLLMIL